MTTGPLLAASKIVVDFPGVRALDGVDFDLLAGEVHALMGENGAGKSTLIRVFTGLQRVDSGSIALVGAPIAPRSPREAEDAGIRAVFQEIDLVPTLSIAENVTLGREPTRFGFVDRGAARRRAASALARLRVDVDVDRTLGACSIATQQLAAIARALDATCRVLILDEPTSSLDADETERLFAVLRELRAQGIGIVFITHFLDHVERIADRVTVLRNGARVGTWPARELSRTALVEAMTGRAIAPTAGAESGNAPRVDEGAPRLSVERIARRHAIAPTSFTMRGGDALGLAGLLGSGRSELVRLVFGADAADAGRVRVDGVVVLPGSVRAAIAAGLALCPEDRKHDGLVLESSVLENIVLALQARRGALRPIPRATQTQLAAHWIERLRIKTPSHDTPVGRLSGGNQQKVLLARWLALAPKVLLLDEPTRGIDVGAKAEILQLVTDLRREGLAVVFVSAEIDEVVRVCDRVLVLRDHAVVTQLDGAAVTEPAILAHIAARHREDGDA
jgi:monosaccharide-transporting ATPase